MITSGCKEAENGTWTEKDILYVIRKVKSKRLQAMFMVYGIDYAANEEICTRLKTNVKDSILDIPGAKVDTKEIEGSIK